MAPETKSLNFIFPTRYVISKSLKFSHWLSESTLCNVSRVMELNPYQTQMLHVWNSYLPLAWIYGKVVGKSSIHSEHLGNWEILVPPYLSIWQKKRSSSTCSMPVPSWGNQDLFSFFSKKLGKYPAFTAGTRWAPINYKWSYKPYKYGFNTRETH